MTDEVVFRSGRGKMCKILRFWGNFYIRFTYCVNDTHIFVTTAGPLIRNQQQNIFTPEKINIYENKKFNFQTIFI